MSEFMILYRGKATDMSEMSAEQAQEVMGKWATWMEGVGAALKDVGSPFGPAASVLDNGSSGSAADLTGYSILEAADMAAAQALVEGHPYLSDNDGLFAIDIFEMMPVPMQE